MRKLINNDLLYYFGRYVMPVIGGIVTICTLMLFWKQIYFYFFHYNSYTIYYRILSSEDLRQFEDVSVEGLDSKYFKWKGVKIILWHSDKDISIHTDSKYNSDCIISSYSSSLWDRNMNRQIYYLLNN